MHKMLMSLLCCFLVLASVAQQKSNVEKLDALIVQGMKDWQIPGLAAIVVKEGEVVFKRTYGVKDLGTGEPVDESTLFNMASTTKAVIAISLAMLVDDGKLDLNDKVTEHVPYFKLSDPYITADARVVDLLTHNLGIDNADWLWSIDSVSTAETIKRFQFTKKTYPLRGGFVYQNIMYAVAGEVISAASGQPWVSFLKERVFTPLEMHRTQAKSKDILKAGNYVAPYLNDPEAGIVKVDYNFADQIGAAGMLWSTPDDIANYLTFLTNDGIYRSDTLVKPKTFKNLFKPHALLTDDSTYPTNALTKPAWNTYGLGWFQQDYRGTKLDFHTGSLEGLVAIAGVVHEKGLAVYVFANLDHAELRHAIMYKAIDLFGFDDDSRDWHKEVFDLYAGIRDKSRTALEKKREERVKGTTPSLPLSSYTGIYQNEMLGSAKVTLQNDRLQVNFNDFVSFDMAHWHYDTFRATRKTNWGEEFFFNFQLNRSGKAYILDLYEEEFIKEE